MARKIDDTTQYVEIHDGGYHGAFRLNDGELMETVEFIVLPNTDFIPDWDEEGPTDLQRGDNPALQVAVRAVLEQITADKAAA